MNNDFNVMKCNIFSRYSRAMLMDVMRERLKRNSGGRLLDVGCGIGLAAQLLSDKLELHGIDIDEKAIQYMSRRHPGHFVLGSALQLPYEKDYFDYVLCTGVLEHIEDDLTALEEMRRVLKPEGRLILMVPSLDGVVKPSNVCHEHSTEKHYRQGYHRQTIYSLLNGLDLAVLHYEYGMIFASTLLFELTKRAYSIVNPAFGRQSDLLKCEKSFLFKFYKSFFFIPLIAIWMDRTLLKRIMRGGLLLIVAGKKDLGRVSPLTGGSEG